MESPLCLCFRSSMQFKKHCFHCITDVQPEGPNLLNQLLPFMELFNPLNPVGLSVLHLVCNVTAVKSAL